MYSLTASRVGMRLMISAFIASMSGGVPMGAFLFADAKRIEASCASMPKANACLLMPSSSLVASARHMPQSPLLNPGSKRLQRPKSMMYKSQSPFALSAIMALAPCGSACTKPHCSERKACAATNSAATARRVSGGASSTRRASRTSSEVKTLVVVKSHRTLGTLMRRPETCSSSSSVPHLAIVDASCTRSSSFDKASSKSGRTQP
mmetsp:Transcript_27876/g.93792  ORF Transcript_27876/g.93792 Transcript_27876/m.93792 type:complete len:206 (-) Transcript_27876:655-1272(-)